MENILGGIEIVFIINLAVSVALGFMIGFERETRNKDAGISTSIFIVSGAMLFTFISGLGGSNESTRIAAQVVSGIGFIGAGLIIRDGSNVKNLTTAAGVWFAAAVGMAIGYHLYVVAILAALVATFIPRIPYYKRNGNAEGKITLE